MAATKLVIQAVTAQQTLRMDLSQVFRGSPGEGMDPANPSFSQRVFTHSLLKEGGTLALESLALKELQFPLRLGEGTKKTKGEVFEEVAELNQIINTPGATCEWQDEGATQPTVFDLSSGQFDVEYNYREHQQNYVKGLLRLFVQPLGRKAGPRLLATASGVGPLLMISPYASGGGLVAKASTQAGVAGFGGQQQPSGGVFYWGNPSLAGDAPAQLQISYVGPLPNTASNAGVLPYAMAAILPDQNYRPLITIPEVSEFGGTIIKSAVVPASQYANLQHTANAAADVETVMKFAPAAGAVPPANWAGQHRILVIARASGTGTGEPPGGFIEAFGPGWGAKSTASPPLGLDWGLYDLGTISMRASEPVVPNVEVAVRLHQPGAGSVAADIAGFIMLPEATSWFLNPVAVSASTYGYPPGMSTAAPAGYWSNTILLDDTLGDQFVYAGGSQTAAPSPTGMAASAQRMTTFSRGVVPRADPKNGPPIIAIVGVPQNSTPTSLYQGLLAHYTPAASWTNNQNLRTVAQVNVLERVRYVLP